MRVEGSGLPSGLRVVLAGARLEGPEPFGETVLPLAGGQLTALYGRNGVGKSRVLAGLDATVRTVRPPRRDRCSGSLVFSVVDGPVGEPGRGYVVSAVPWLAGRLRDLGQRLGVGAGDAGAGGFAELLSVVVAAALRADRCGGPAPGEVAAAGIDAVAAAVREDPHVALTVPFAGDDVDPGELRPVLVLPAVPAGAAEALAAIDADDPGVEAAQLRCLRAGLEGGADGGVVPVPLRPPEAVAVVVGLAC